MKPLASLSLDLDNQWSYMKTHGDAGWRSFPSYLNRLVPRVLDFLARRELRVTVFVVGQDAALAGNREALAAIGAAGHEIGNHSFHHQPWLHLFTEEEIDAELARAEEAIATATGQRPSGFRGPGFSLSLPTLRVLARRGYRYDASTLPTFLGPLARAYYLLSARLTSEEKRQRRRLFGGLAEGLRPLAPYRWRLGEERLLEIPVTTMPGLRTPIHASYLLYLAMFSPAAAAAYWRAALALCRRRGIGLSLLLHPLDFLGCDDGLGELDFFPAMRLPSERKLELLGGYLEAFCARFEVVPLGHHAATLAARPDLPEIEPRFGGQEAEGRPTGEGGITLAG